MTSEGMTTVVGTASVLSWIFAAQGIPKLIAGFLLGLSSDATLVLIVTILVFVPLGAVLEGVPAMIILVPVFFPIVARFGVDPLHYGVLVVAALGLGLFVPPFGVGFFIACALGRTSVEGAARAYVPYVVALLVGLFLVGLRAVDHPGRPATDEALKGNLMTHELRATPDTCFWGFFDSTLATRYCACARAISCASRRSPTRPVTRRTS